MCDCGGCEPTSSRPAVGGTRSARNKPEVAEMLMRSGCMLSLGLSSAPIHSKIIPSDRLLAETDAADTGMRMW